MPGVKPITDDKRLAVALRITLLLTQQKMDDALVEGRVDTYDPDFGPTYRGMVTVVQTAEDLAGLVWSESEGKHIEIE